MKFDTLHKNIPYVVGGKQKILTTHPYNAITLALPGRHAKDTDPIGGDFVVMIDDENMDWTRHQFTHADLFGDLEAKAKAEPMQATLLMRDYLKIIRGASPVIGAWTDNVLPAPFESIGIHPQTLLYAVQCLAIAEHRRYAQHEAKFGGRYLPFRASAGIVEGLWTALDASERTRRRGRIGIEWLEKEFGTPVLSKELMK